MAVFVNRDPGRTQLRPAIEIMPFRVTCGEFIGIGRVMSKDKSCQLRDLPSCRTVFVSGEACLRCKL